MYISVPHGRTTFLNLVSVILAVPMMPRFLPQRDVRQLDDEVWALLYNVSNGRAALPPSFPSSYSKSSSPSRVPTSSSSFSTSRWPERNLSPRSPSSGILSSVRPTRPQPYSPGRAPRLQSQNTLSKTSATTSGGSKYALVYKSFSLHQDDLLYWQLPAQFKGNKVTVAILTNQHAFPLPHSPHPHTLLPLVSQLSTLPMANV
ncbi:uncharacterized protein LOC113167665 [Anabas testudineus]|uniref:uncharacterized protein LOC113167665 n=1 Tax=Anabas testudineus TaxID=64144 RepID=UPI000E45AFC0|nr:uncharacterized protein LOC113167665 [Anabas testudineus]